MNVERLSGICRQFVAKIYEAWGDLTGDPARVAAARHQQILAKNQQRRGIANEQSAREMKDFTYRNRNWHF